MNFENQFNETLKHSILIIWSEEKQKWAAECPMLNLRLEASSYKNLLADVVKKIVLQDDNAYTFAEEHKTKLEE